MIDAFLKQHEKSIIEFGERLFQTPELGFKEFKTKQLILEKLKEFDIYPTKEYFETGFEITLDNHCDTTIGLIAELDAIPTQNHPCSVNGIAHSCAHSVQVAIMTYAFIALKQQGIDCNLKLFYTPAEEYTDLDYRQSLIKQGKIHYPSGKQNMIMAHCFDDCDMIISCHGMGKANPHRFSVHSTLAGFIYKKIHFLGRSAHAAIAPHVGLNALNAYTLFQNGIGLLRETFQEKDMVRIHGMVTKGGDTINSIPSEVIYECYVRTLNQESLFQVNEQVSQVATHTAQALGCHATIEDTNGYLPLTQCKQINDIIYQKMTCLVDRTLILENEKSMAAGDVGDLSMFKPTVQFGFTGFEGYMHGVNMGIENPYQVYIEPIWIVCQSIMELVNNVECIQQIRKENHPKISFEAYKNYLDSTSKNDI